MRPTSSADHVRRDARNVSTLWQSSAKTLENRGKIQTIACNTLIFIYF